MSRESLKALRPKIKGISKSKNDSPFEKFQSITLRPIVKYQNSLILKQFSAYLEKYKVNLSGKSLQEKEQFINQALKTNQQLKSFYRGIITGLFTDSEFDFYVEEQAEINKRITSLLIERIKSQL